MDSKTISYALSKHFPRPEGNYIHSSVMALLIYINGELNLIFTKRADSLSQPGDICFPGGRRNMGETTLEAAYREVYEEIGVKKENIILLGQPDYPITPFNMIITPYVGLIDGISLEDIKPQTEEVAEIFTVPLNFFMTEKPLETYIDFNVSYGDNFPIDLIEGGENYKWRRSRMPQLFYLYNGKVIWGLTARITSNICKIIKESLNEPLSKEK